MTVSTQATATAVQGHEPSCYCVECVAFRGGFSPEEYTGWVRAQRKDSHESLRNMAQHHYDNKRNGIQDPATVEPANAVKAHTAGPTEKQVAFLTTLVNERTVDQHGITDVAALVAAGLSKRDCSGLIERLLAMPKAAKPVGTPATDSPDVPEGYYAVDSATGNNDLDFYKVDCPQDGKWAGRVFVKRVIGGHPETPVRGTEAKAALGRIAAAGWQAAAERYGQEIGRCGKCNRTLTDEESRAHGIGPVCRQGW